MDDNDFRKWLDRSGDHGRAVKLKIIPFWHIKDLIQEAEHGDDDARLFLKIFEDWARLAADERSYCFRCDVEISNHNFGGLVILAPETNEDDAMGMTMQFCYRCAKSGPMVLYEKLKDELGDFGCGLTAVQ
jgi:hypothetical protein